MNINPGEFRENIKIIDLGTGATENGYPNPARSTIHTCKAKFSRMSCTEIFKSDADFSNVKVRFLIRYTSKNITKKMIVEYKSLDYEIEDLNDYDDRHEYIEILANRTAI